LKNKKRGQACTSPNKKEKRRGGKNLWRQSNYHTPSRTMLCGRGHGVVHQNRRWKIKFGYQVASHVHAWIVRVPRICWHVLSKHQQVILFKNKKDNVKIPKRPLDLVNYLKNRCESTITALMQTLFFLSFPRQKIYFNCTWIMKKTKISLSNNSIIFWFLR